MLLLLLLPLVSLSVASASADASAGMLYAAAPEGRGAYHVGGRNTYHYGYNTGDGTAKVEVKHQDGSVTGSYRYFDPLGRQIVRSYIADKRGFRVLGNDLPSNPGGPALGFVDSQTLTGAVEGTQEFSTLSLSNPPKTDIVILNSQNQGPVNTFQRSQTHDNQHDDISNTISDSIDQQIKHQQQQLADLIAKKKQLVKEYNEQLEKEKQKFQNQNQLQSRNAGYFTSLNQASGGGNYLYSQDNVQYDFPAGFAYNIVPAPVLNTVGVKGYEADHSVTAGHTVSARHSLPPVAPYIRNEQSRYHNTYNTGRNTNYASNRRPYVIGHYK